MTAFISCTTAQQVKVTNGNGDSREVVNYEDTIRVVQIVTPKRSDRQDYTVVGVNKSHVKVEFFSNSLYTTIDDVLYIDMNNMTAKRLKTGDTFEIYGQSYIIKPLDYSAYKKMQ
jgi:hypothetical protein